MSYKVIYVVGQGYGWMSDKEYDNLPKGAKQRTSVVHSGIRSEKLAKKAVNEEQRSSGIEWKRDTTYYTRDGKHMETGQQRLSRAKKKLLKGFRKIEPGEFDSDSTQHANTRTRTSSNVRIYTKGLQPYIEHKDGSITTEDGTYFPPPLSSDEDYAAHLREVNKRNR